MYPTSSRFGSPYSTSLQPSSSAITREEQELIEAMAASELSHRDEQQRRSELDEPTRIALLLSQWQAEHPSQTTTTGQMPSTAPTPFPVGLNTLPTPRIDVDFERALAESSKTHFRELQTIRAERLELRDGINLSQQEAQKTARERAEEEAYLASLMAASRREAEEAASKREFDQALDDSALTQALTASQLPTRRATAVSTPTYVVKSTQLEDLQIAIEIAKTDSRLSINNYQTTINGAGNVELRLDFASTVRVNLAVEQLRTNHGMFARSEPVRAGHSIQLNAEQTKEFFDKFFPR